MNGSTGGVRLIQNKLTDESKLMRRDDGRGKIDAKPLHVLMLNEVTGGAKFTQSDLTDSFHDEIRAAQQEGNLRETGGNERSTECETLWEEAR